MVKYYTSLLFFLILSAGFSQHSGRVVLLDCTNPLSTSEKIILEEVHALDDQALLSIDGSLLKLRVAANLPMHRLTSSLNALGVGVFTPHVCVRGSRDLISMEDEFPAAPNTGDKQADRIAFAEAKQAWLNEHPCPHLTATNTNTAAEEDR